MTPTQRLTREACGTGSVPLGELVAVALALAFAFAVGVGVPVRVRVGAGLAVETFREVVGVADGVALAAASRVLVAVGDFGAVLAGVGVSLAVVAFVAFVAFVDATAGLEVVTDGTARGEDEPAAVPVGDVGDAPVVVGIGVDVGVGSVGVGVGLVGAGVGVVEVVLGVAAVAGVEADVVGGGSGVVGATVELCKLVAADVRELGVALGDGLGEAAGNCSGSHDWPLDVVAALAAVLLAAMARVAPEAAVSRTLPAISVTVAGRACAKRMKRPTSAARYCRGTTHPVRSGFMRGSARRGMPPIGHQAPSRALPPPAPPTALVPVLSVIRCGRWRMPL